MCNGDLGDKQTPEGAYKQWSQWRQAQEVALGQQQSSPTVPVMSQSEPKSTREAAEQALIALAAKMEAQQARNQKLEARVKSPVGGRLQLVPVVVMEANEMQSQADASQCCCLPTFQLAFVCAGC